MPKRPAVKNSHAKNLHAKNLHAKNLRAESRPAGAQPRRKRESPAATAGSRKPQRSVAMRLAEEVARLELELAAARSRMSALELRAAVDPLTDLVNRRGLERELKRALAYIKRHGASAALIYLDLDQFKSINDRYGHAAGDAVLKAVAMVLARHVRTSDLVARVGGDEFVILLWSLDTADAQTKAGSLEAAIGRMTATHGDVQLSVGASAGSTALLPLDTVAGALERADRAMYARKTNRRDPVLPKAPRGPHPRASGG